MSDNIFAIAGTLIEAAKVGNMSKILGRSKSEDSVCNSLQNATSAPVHGQVRVTYAQNSPQHAYGYHGAADASAVVPESTSSPAASRVSTTTHTHLSAGTHFMHTTTGGLIYIVYTLSSYKLIPCWETFCHLYSLSGLTAIAALKRKRKKFSSSKNICPVTESIAAANSADLLNDKVCEPASVESNISCE